MLRRSGFTVVLVAILALLAFQMAPAFAHHKTTHDKGGGSVQDADRQASDHDGDADSDSGTTYTEDNDTNDYDDGRPDEGNNIADDGDNAHPSGKDRSVENGSGIQGHSESNPDDSKGPMRYEGDLGDDKPNGPGGTDRADQDGNNGCGNDDDFDDDNNGWCGKPKDDDTQVQGTSAVCAAEMLGTGETCDDTVEETVQASGVEQCVDDMATADDECGDDTVLGKLVHQAAPVKAAPATVAAASLGAPEVAAAPAALPFTGTDLIPFAVTGLGMIGAGTALVRRRR